MLIVYLKLGLTLCDLLTGINDTIIINDHDDDGADHNNTIILDWPQNSVASRACCDQYDHYGSMRQLSAANHLVDRAEVDLYEMFSV